LLVGALVGLEAGLPAYPLLAGLAAIILAGNVIAVLSSEPAREPAGPVGRALWAGATGGALGGLLVGDPSVGWGVHGAFPAVALLPSVLGSVWGGYRLWKFSDIVPRGLHGVALQRADARDARGPAMRILAGSLLRLVGTTIVLSGVVIVLVSSLTSGADRLGLFVGFGCVALVTMLVNLLDSLGHPRLALVAAAASVATELVLSGAAPWRTSTPGTALILGALVGTLIALPVLLNLSLRPGRVLATRLWVQ
jgi:hypothetical protein